MSKIKVLPTIILLAPFVFSFAFAMDIYVPVVPEMRIFFHATQANIQLTLSLFMLAMGIGQLFAGPITDQYGRRPVLIISILLFTLGSIFCAIANALPLLFIGRITQALGGCGMLVAAFAIVRDQFSGNDAARVYSFLNCGISMSPLFAPIIGGYLATWFNWRAIFIFLIILGVIITGLAVIKIKETLVAEKKVNIDAHIFLRYWRILTNRTFIAYAFCTTSGLTIFFTFFSSSPYIIINLLHKPMQEFGYYFFVGGSAFFVGSLISGNVANRVGAFKMVLLGSILVLLSGITMLIWYQLSGVGTLQFLMPTIVLALGGAFMMGAGAGGAMEPFPSIAGSAAALMGCLQFLLGSAIGTWVMHWPVNSTNPLALTMTTAGILTLLVLVGYAFIKTQVKGNSFSNK